MTCKHQFIKIADVDKPYQVGNRNMPGVSLGCALCGEIRELYIDGNLSVVITHGKSEPAPESQSGAVSV